MAVGDMWQVANPITGKPKQLPVLKTFKVYFYANDFHMPAIKNNYILLKKKKSKLHTVDLVRGTQTIILKHI